MQLNSIGTYFMFIKNILIGCTLLLMGIDSEAKSDGLTKLSGFYCSEWELFNNNEQCFCFNFLSESEYVYVSGGANHEAPVKSLNPRPYRIEAGSVHLTYSDGSIVAYKLVSSKIITSSDGHQEFIKRIDLPEFCRD